MLARRLAAVVSFIVERKAVVSFDFPGFIQVALLPCCPAALLPSTLPCLLD
jgi:hypothetical protein